MKPGILFGNLVTLIAGMLLASKGNLNLQIFVSAIAGLTCIMASGCICNNYIDRHIDQKMSRTKNRSIASGAIPVSKALLFAAALAISGSVILLWYTNILAFGAAILGFVVYVFMYSLWKCRTIYGTAIGAVAGAMPPVVGYLAVSGKVDAGMCIFFLMMILWQMPHFFAIAIRHIDDYAAAGIPVLPLMKTSTETKSRALIYVMAFTLVAMQLTFFGYTGKIYLILILALGSGWLLICIRGFKTSNDQQWGKEMFQYSLLTIMLLCLAIPLDKA